ncbi:uncharacterized protein LOC127875284 [Dreissena polymorpha]|uniref:Uncharacterized protein n=1 Tax=Dreissena polymorpha TaxID=45954 RepID=A0A9D4L8D3_DREPO|nr:uncharacterized protein LOC127875284 [Dreissena polymorpha]KAH3853431.1 hypothetical protein DPMN_095954 [Dreissena polymorpha]
MLVTIILVVGFTECQAAFLMCLHPRTGLGWYNNETSMCAKGIVVPKTTTNPTTTLLSSTTATPQPSNAIIKPLDKWQFSGASTLPMMPAHRGHQLPHPVLTSLPNVPSQSVFQPLQVIAQNILMPSSHGTSASTPLLDETPFGGLTDEFERFLEEPFRGTKRTTPSDECTGIPPLKVCKMTDSISTQTELTEEVCSSLDNGFRKLRQAVDENTKVLMCTQRLMRILVEELSAIKRLVPIDKDD